MTTLSRRLFLDFPLALSSDSCIRVPLASFLQLLIDIDRVKQQSQHRFYANAKSPSFGFFSQAISDPFQIFAP
jgi:hypothetical protein